MDGQKVWTSGARVCDIGFLIARSDPAAPKHQGMTAFVVPMDSDGVTVRPICQMTGGSAFNEVFLDGVLVPETARIGDVGFGWKVALAMLGHERSVSGAGVADVGADWEQVHALAKTLGVTADPAARDRLSDLYIRYRVLDLTNDRVLGALAAGDDPGPVGSIAKLLWSQNLTRVSNVVASLLGMRITADTGEWGTYAWGEHLLGAPGYRIAGGSDEIQRNLIGERALGLPRS
jgi:alkylation response protein AidB-like acyl-CoA dehydrogenase